MVSWRDGGVTGPRSVRLDAFGAGACRIAAGSPLGVLSALRLPFRTRGSCDALYVLQVGRDRAAGQQGWVYKVGHRLPSRSASDPGLRVRGGQRIVWFWCVQALRCQRTLDVHARSTGVGVRATITGYDDFGRGRRVAHASVRVVRTHGGSRVVRIDRHGVVRVRVRGGTRVVLSARRHGMVPSFPVGVTVR
jgi:hypothetical protein